MESLNSADLKKTIQTKLKNATRIHDVEEIWRAYLGRKGTLTARLRQLKDLPEDQRRKEGRALNQLKEELNELFESRIAEIQEREFEEKAQSQWVDVSRPPRKHQRGSVHPITKTTQRAEEIFSAMGFAIAEGPEVEDDWHNFEALNIPADHPARDMWDTIWLKPRSRNLLLRTHTSPAQVRYMRQNNPPIRIIVPGRVFRYEATDASHDFQFYQLEGLMVADDISVANFRAVMNEFFSRFFGQEVKTRLRPGYFPFVEPGFEVDITCVLCNRKGCSMCSQGGWLELLGAGMVHPKVFEAAGYNPKEVTGFAFGVGLDRLAAIKYGIDDVRLFRSGDLRFLKQFK